MEEKEDICLAEIDRQIIERVRREVPLKRRLSVPRSSLSGGCFSNRYCTAMSSRRFETLVHRKEAEKIPGLLVPQILELFNL